MLLDLVFTPELRESGDDRVRRNYVSVCLSVYVRVSVCVFCFILISVSVH